MYTADAMKAAGAKEEVNPALAAYAEKLASRAAMSGEVQARTWAELARVKLSLQVCVGGGDSCDGW